MAEIKIEYFEREDRECKNETIMVGVFGVIITYGPKKLQKIRNVAVFTKEDKKWLSFPTTLVGGERLPIYEQEPKLSKEIYSSILSALEKEYI